MPDRYTPEQLLELNGSIVEALPDAVIVVNQEGEIVMFNHRAELLFGFSRREVVGKCVDMFVPEEVRQDHLIYRARFMAMPITREMGSGINLHALDNSGKPFHVNIHLAPVTLMGAGKHVIAVIRRTKMPEPQRPPAPIPTQKPPFGSGNLPRGESGAA